MSSKDSFFYVKCFIFILTWVYKMHLWKFWYNFMKFNCSRAGNNSMNYIALPSSFSIPISRRMKWNHNIILNTISFLYNIQYNTFKLIFLSKNVFLISPQVWCVATGHPAGRMIGVIVAPSWVCNPFTFAISWSPSWGAHTHQPHLAGNCQIVNY